MAVSHIDCIQIQRSKHCMLLHNGLLCVRRLNGNGLNVEQPSYNILVKRNSFLYMIAHMWNQLAAIAKFHNFALI